MRVSQGIFGLRVQGEFQIDLCLWGLCIRGLSVRLLGSISGLKLENSLNSLKNSLINACTTSINQRVVLRLQGVFKLEFAYFVGIAKSAKRATVVV